MLYKFCSQLVCVDGAQAEAPLIQASDGNFYGTTKLGGVGDFGTIFKITQQGAFTTLYSFCAQAKCADGYYPVTALIQGNDGNLYGTTSAGGANGSGTVFKITANGVLTTVASFGQGNRLYPKWLFQATDGNFYGTARSGIGMILKLSVGLSPFVETQPTSGAAGSTVATLGTNLKGATAVSFNGTPATFTVVSSSEITASVPSSAASGTVSVKTPKGTLVSNIAFQVTP